MKKKISSIVVGVVSALLVGGLVVFAQPISGGGGLTQVIHTAVFQGKGTTPSPFDLAPCGSSGQTWTWNGSTWACATAGGGLSGLTTNTIPKATSASTIADSTVTDDANGLVTVAAATGGVNRESLALSGAGTGITDTEDFVLGVSNASQTFDATAAQRNSYGIYSSTNAQRSAGANSVLNIAIRSEAASGTGVVPYSFYSNTGQMHQTGNVDFGGTLAVTGEIDAFGGLDVTGLNWHSLLNWTGSTNQDSYIRGGKTAGTVWIGDTNTGGVNIGASGNLTTIEGALTSILGANTFGETEDNMTTASNSSGTLTDVSFARTARGVWWTWTGAGTLDGFGFTVGTPTDGQHFRLCVIGGGSLTLPHENAGETTAGRRFDFSSSNGVAIPTGTCKDMFYDLATLRWREADDGVTQSTSSISSNAIVKSAGNHNITASGITDNGTTVTIAAAENLSLAYTGAQPASYVATYSGTTQAADHYAIQATNSGTYNTTAAGRNAYGINVSSANSISAGTNTLTSVAGWFSNTSSGANINAWALITDSGDVKFNATSGTTKAHSDFSVDGTTFLNNTTVGTGVTLTANYTSTAQTGNRFVEQISNTGTFDATAAVRTAYGSQISSNATRSAGANSLTDIALDVTASGAQSNIAINTKDGDVDLNQASGNIVVGGTTNNPHITFTDSSQRPTIANCGTVAPTVVGSDESGFFTTAAGITNACAITFHTAFSANIDCNSWMTGAGTQVSFPALTIATGSLTFAAAGGGALGTGLKVHWSCNDH